MIPKPRCIRRLLETNDAGFALRYVAGRAPPPVGWEYQVEILSRLKKSDTLGVEHHACFSVCLVRVETATVEDAPLDLGAAWTDYLEELVAIRWMYRLDDRVGACWHGRQALARWRGRVSR